MTAALADGPPSLHPVTSSIGSQETKAQWWRPQQRGWGATALHGRVAAAGVRRRGGDGRRPTLQAAGSKADELLAEMLAVSILIDGGRNAGGGGSAAPSE